MAFDSHTGLFYLLLLVDLLDLEVPGEFSSCQVFDWYRELPLSDLVTGVIILLMGDSYKLY